jgi:hypothetical protein
MTRARLPLLLPLLAVAACQTQRRPLDGFDTQPPGSMLLDFSNPASNILEVWPIFDLPTTPQRRFIPRLNGQDVALMTSDEGFYDYYYLDLSGWTGGWGIGLTGVPPGTYTVELVDENGQSFGQTAPLLVPPRPGPTDLYPQDPAAILAHYSGHQATWIVDPSTQDADPTTDEITVTNLLDEDVAVQRCAVSNEKPTSCTSVGTVAPGADFLTVETLAALSVKDDHQALFIQRASDPSQFYQRDLLQGTGSLFFGGSCQIERILVHGIPSVSDPTNVTGFMEFAMSSCLGYASGGN